MAKAMAAMLLMIIGVVIGFLVLIYGWGLEPQSWGYIITGTVAQLIIIATSQGLTGD